MSVEASLRFACVAAVAALATAGLARLAARIGWTDGARGAAAERKLQRRPVPCVGGAALALALACAGGLPDGGGALWARWLPPAPWCVAALLGVLAAGALDDRVGLAPGPKLLAQLAGLAPLALGAVVQGHAGGAVVLLAVGLVALNVLNTFDNADGALAGLCALGFGAAAPLASAACLGFLPFNLDAARHPQSRAPSAYLGDAGAFLLGGLVVLEPRAAGLLVLPALDLARLALVRWRAGSRPWIGDRRHLAHRLEARGLARTSVAALLCLIAAPACVLVARGLARGAPGLALLGAGATAAAFAVALAAARPVDAEPR